MTEQQQSDLGELQPVRDLAVKAVGKAWADNMNQEYGFEPGKEYFVHTDDEGNPMPGTENNKVRAYTPEDCSEDQDCAPLAKDLVTFVMWLRHNTDFFDGPDYKTMNMYPHHDDPEFYEVLAQNSIIYTGE